MTDYPSWGDLGPAGDAESDGEASDAEVLNVLLVGMTELRERVFDLAATVEKIGGDDEEGPDPRLQRFRFERAKDDKAALTAHHELMNWVPWLVATYHLHDHIPSCWPRHDGLAEELAGIYLAWSAAWTKDAKGDSVVIWHEQLDRLRNRVAVWLAGTKCGPECHLDAQLASDRQRRWAETVDPVDAASFRVHRTRVELPAPLPPRRSQNPSATTKGAAS